MNIDGDYIRLMRLHYMYRIGWVYDNIPILICLDLDSHTFGGISEV